ncbi:MAG: hypothetical protein NTZ49_03720 [Candidatus Parcubacteria bacterium]|nr:hypothetical protein [Candidatus Parcubacteria bacterium]
MVLKKDRKLNRWQGYDYSFPGYYFVTICTKGRGPFFGEIKDFEKALNDLGKIAHDYWQEIPKHFKNCELDEFIVMPNHIHGILYIFYNNEDEYRKNVGNADLRSLRNTKMVLPKIILQYKSSVTRRINNQFKINFAWQKSFHDRVIRNDDELSKIRDYIFANPAKWAEDQNNPINTKI